MRVVAKGFRAVALAVGLVACDATQTTSTAPSLSEGSLVSITGRSSVSIPTVDGKLVSVVTREWAIDGIVTNGIAEAKKGRVTEGPAMPALAIAEDHPLAKGRANERLFRSVTDRDGKLQDFVFINGAAGPAKTIVHLENGKISQSYSYDWQRVRGGWKAKSFAVSLFKDGKLVATIRSGAKVAPTGISAMIAADDPCMFDAEYAAMSGNCDSAPTFGGGSGGYGGGGGGGPCSCASQLQDYLLAAAAFATATQAAIDTGTALIPWVAAGLAVAGTAAAIMLMRYNSCVRSCAQMYGSVSAPAFVAPIGPARHSLARARVMRA